MRMALPRQPELNIGTLGHVDHGKTTLLQAITGVWAARHSEELKRGITIKLGYADAAFYKCPECPPPECYSTQPVCPNCGSETEFLRSVSFVDAPGHEILMTTTLSGANVMDGALLVIAADEPCPQPQTREHLAAAEIVGIKNIVVVQNKIDIVSEEEAFENYRQIEDFLKGTVAEGAPIIPVSAQHAVNVDALIEAIEEYIPTPERDLTKPPRMYVVRSFDVNKPGTPAEKLVGGVIGGSILQGRFRVGDEIELRPGITARKGGRMVSEPMFTVITSLHVGGMAVEEAVCGGLVGVGTELDPSLTKSDGLVGNVVGRPGTLPPVLDEVRMEVRLFERAVGTRNLVRVERISRGEKLLLNIGTARTMGVVTDVSKDAVEAKLAIPVCAEAGDRAAISRRIEGRWRLIGYGILT